MGEASGLKRPKVDRKKGSTASLKQLLIDTDHIPPRTKRKPPVLGQATPMRGKAIALMRGPSNEDEEWVSASGDSSRAHTPIASPSASSPPTPQHPPAQGIDRSHLGFHAAALSSQDAFSPKRSG